MREQLCGNAYEHINNGHTKGTGVKVCIESISSKARTIESAIYVCALVITPGRTFSALVYFCDIKEKCAVVNIIRCRPSVMTPT